MDAQFNNISLLLQLHLKGELTESQRQELEQWLNASAQNRALPESLSGDQLHAGLREMAGIDTAQARQQIPRSLFRAQEQPLPQITGRRKIHAGWWAAAAAVLVLSTAVYLFTADKQGQLPAGERQSQVATATAHKGPVLTLSDGTVIALGEADNGTLAQQGGTRVIKLANGQLAYKAADTKGSGTFFNTIATPRGSKYVVLLPDGSKVWLNAASSLRYPTAFTHTREVTLTGEAYFDIAANTGLPFKVHAGAMQVQVLGTAFNVMAYDNEAAVAATLLEGRVAVGDKSTLRQLKPGEQALLQSNGTMQVTSQVNIHQVVAWKNNYLQFDETELAYVMRQIERWYDVAVRYEGGVPDRKFGGKILLSSPLSDVLKALELSKVHCRLDGRTIIITNN
jgi:ferric-dicitrate binding protein FerR (iron transport regulator)